MSQELNSFKDIRFRMSCYYSGEVYEDILSPIIEAFEKSTSKDAPVEPCLAALAWVIEWNGLGEGEKISYPCCCWIAEDGRSCREPAHFDITYFPWTVDDGTQACYLHLGEMIPQDTAFTVMPSEEPK